MKKILATIVILLGATTVNGQSGLGLMGGVNTSTSTADDVKWRVGGFIGGLYDIQFNDWFYLQPRLVFSYQENLPDELWLAPVYEEDQPADMTEAVLVRTAK